jgi:hypothetical protein
MIPNHCSFIQDEVTKEIVQVFAPNGEPSELFAAALDYYQDRKKALRIWSIPYTNKFKQRYGDWRNGVSNIQLDKNGEPLIDTIIYTPSAIRKIVQQQFGQWWEVQPGKDPWILESTAKRFKAAFEKKFPEVKIEFIYNQSVPGKVRLKYVSEAMNFLYDKPTREELQKQKDQVNVIMDKLVPKFRGLTYEWISPSQLKQDEHYWNVDGIRSFVRNNKIYLVEGRVIPEDAMEEVMHVFVEFLRRDRPSLFTGLFNALKEDPAYKAEIANLEQAYRGRKKLGDVEAIIKSEALAKNLGIAMREEMSKAPEGRKSTLMKLLDRFFEWLSKLLDMKEVSVRTKLSSIAEMINTDMMTLPTPEGDPYIYYSTEPEAEENSNFNPEDREDLDKVSPRNKGKSARDLNIEKAKLELVKLDAITNFLKGNLQRATKSKKQLEVIQILRKNVEDKLSALEEGRMTIGVTKYIGSEDTEVMDEFVTKLGANYGNFYHYLMEELQEEYAKTGTSPAVIMASSEFFDNFFKKNQKLLMFRDYDKQTIKNAAIEIASQMGTLISNGKLLLPEISIAVEDLNGNLVLGRLDLLGIDINGNVEIIDLKTKKTELPIENNMFPAYTFTKNNDVKGQFKDGVGYMFSQIKNRSALDKYNMQLAVYSEMLNKLGINVNGRTIWAIAYKYKINDKENSRDNSLLGYMMKTYRDLDLLGIIDGSNQPVESNPIEMAARQSFRDLSDMSFDTTLPGQGKENPFAMVDPETQNSMIKGLLDLVSSQFESLTDEVKRIQEDKRIEQDTREAMIDRLKRRQASLLNVRENLKKDFTGEGTEQVALAKAVLIKMAIDVFKSEIEYMSERIKTLDIPEVYDLNSSENNVVLSQMQSYMKDLDNMSDILQMFKNSVMLSSAKDEVASREISRILSEMREDIAQITDSYFKVSRNVVKAILKETLGGQKSMKVFGEIRDILASDLKFIERQIEKIEKNVDDTTEMSYGILRRITNLLGVKPSAAKLESYQKKRDEIVKMMEINEFDDKTIDAYLDGVFGNPDSIFYMGSTMQGSTTGISVDDLIGANANSEAIVNAMWQYMYNLKDRGRVEFLKWADSLGIDRLKQDAIASMGGVTQANVFLSEEVDVPVRYDEDGNVTETKRIRRFKDPVSQSFYDTHDKFTVDLRNLNNKIDEINSQLSDNPEESVANDLRAKRDVLRDQLAEKRKDFINWKIDETSTRLKPEVLRLQLGSGADIAEITELQEAITAMIREAGSDAYLTDMQQTLIDQMEADISKILASMRDKDPAATERYKQLQEYYTFRPNWNLWQKKLSAIEAEGDPKKVERWHYNNSDRVPTESYNRRIEDIFNRIAEIKGGTDPQFEAITKEMAAIRSKSMVRGRFNYRFMEEADIKRYQELEEMRDDYAKNREDDILSEEDADELESLFSELKSMRKKVLRPEFEKDYRELRERVLKSHTELLRLQRELEKAPADQHRRLTNEIEDQKLQYMRNEDAFAAFFDKNSKTKYKRGVDAVVKGIGLKEQWNAYLYMNMPSDPNDIELVPNKRYRIKVLKDNAYNPDYQESFVKNKFGKGNYPMPKGVKLNKDTNKFEIARGAKYANPEFQKILDNDIANEFYSKWVVENFLLKQREASGQNLGFSFPFVNQLGFDNVMTKGMTGVAREMQAKVQELTYGGSEFEKATNESGIAGKNKILFKENYEMPAELTTTNGIEAIVNWNAGFYLNKQMAQLDIIMSSSLNWLTTVQKKLVENKTDPRAAENAVKLQTIIEQVEFNRDKFVYGQLFKKGGDQEEENKILNRKNFRILTGAVAFGRMAFDFGMQGGNLLSGNVQAFLSTSASRHATEGDYLQAKRILYGRFFPAMLRDWGKLSDASFETKLLRFLNPLSKSLDRAMDANTAGKMRRLANRVFNVGEMAMALQDKGELEIGATTALMILLNRRYETFETDAAGNPIEENGVKKIKKDESGNTVYANGLEAFTLKNNSIAIRNDVNLSEKQVEDLKVLIMTEIYRFQGNYAMDTKTRFGSTIMGSLFEFYRKYLMPAISARFQGAASDTYKGVGSAYGWATQEAYMGWYVASFRMARNYGLVKGVKTFVLDGILSLPGVSALGGGKFKSAIQKALDTGIEVGDPYRARAGMAAREILMGYLALQLYYLLRAALYEDDEEDLTWMELQLYRALIKTTNETRSMIPWPGIGKPQDYVDTFGQFTTAFKEGKELVKLMENSYYYMDYSLTGDTKSYDLGYYKSNTIYFEEGDPKVMKNVYDLTGISNIIDMIDPYPRAKQQAQMKK